MKTKYFIVLFLLVWQPVLPAFIGSEVPSAETGPSCLQISPDGQKLLFTGANQQNLYCLELANGQLTQVSVGINCGYRASWSPDSRLVAFKAFSVDNNQLLQTPMIYDLAKKQWQALAPATQQAGIPFFCGPDQIAFTIGKKLLIVTMTNGHTAQFELPGYTNQTPVSPDGRWIVYNDRDDQLWLLNLQTGQKTQFTSDEIGYYEPIWSPRQSVFVASALNGNLFVFSAEDQKVALGPGYHPSWSPDGQWIVFSRPEVLENRELVNKELFAIRPDGTHLQQLSVSTDWEDHPVLSPDGREIWYVDSKSGQLFRSQLTTEGRQLRIARSQSVSIPAISEQKTETETNTPIYTNNSGVYFNIPYLHQAYDTPNWFNGNSACGGTSAVMCLAYYQILAKWPFIANGPEPHTSNFGNYVAEIYSYNGYTYNIGGKDPNGRLGYGAFGFIIQQNWRDTKGFMAQYARQHGLASSVDWYPSRQKALGEIDKQMPFVLLNSLTTAGHYISVIGYDHEATTLIVNDPWGDKNRGYSNYYGRRARYDWPGYNNGYSNLNTVHCFIYFQGTPPAPTADLVPSLTAGPDTLWVNQTHPLRVKIANTGPGASQSTQLTISLQEKINFQTNVKLKTVTVPGLAPNDSVDLALEITIPDSLFGSRFYYLALAADAEDTEFEMDESNNLSSKRYILIGYPQVYQTRPVHGETVFTPQPEIYAKYKDLSAKIDTSGIRLWLDNVEITALSSKSSNSIRFNPQEPLPDGRHQVVLVVPNQLGLMSRKEWHLTTETPTGISRNYSPTAASYLLNNFPNPFNQSTRIIFGLANPAPVVLKIFSTTGEQVRTLIDGQTTAGQHTLTWDGNDESGRPMPAGMYLYRMQIKEAESPFSETRKMLILR